LGARVTTIAIITTNITIITNTPRGTARAPTTAAAATPVPRASREAEKGPEAAAPSGGSGRRSSQERRRSSQERTTTPNKLAAAAVVPERLTRAIDRSSNHTTESDLEKVALAIFVAEDGDDLGSELRDAVEGVPSHMLNPSNVPLSLQW